MRGTDISTVHGSKYIRFAELGSQSDGFKVTKTKMKLAPGFENGSRKILASSGMIYSSQLKFGRIFLSPKM